MPTDDKTRDRLRTYRAKVAADPVLARAILLRMLGYDRWTPSETLSYSNVRPFAYRRRLLEALEREGRIERTVRDNRAPKRQGRRVVAYRKVRDRPTVPARTEGAHACLTTR